MCFFVLSLRTNHFFGCVRLSVESSTNYKHPKFGLGFSLSPTNLWRSTVISDIFYHSVAFFVHSHSAKGMEWLTWPVFFSLLIIAFFDYFIDCFSTCFIFFGEFYRQNSRIVCKTLFDYFYSYQENPSTFDLSGTNFLFVKEFAHEWSEICSSRSSSIENNWLKCPIQVQIPVSWTWYSLTNISLLFMFFFRYWSADRRSLHEISIFHFGTSITDTIGSSNIKSIDVFVEPLSESKRRIHLFSFNSMFLLILVFFLIQARPDECFRKIVNPFYLMRFMAILILIYFFMLMTCFFSGQTLVDIDKKVVFYQADDFNLYQILLNISNDQDYCFHCIQQHFDRDHLRTHIAQQNTHQQRDQALKRIRFFFNIVVITNCVVVFIIFGGPKLITFLSIFSSSLIFGSIYVDNVINAVYFESSVMFMGVVVLFKSLYVILIQIIAIEKKKASWEILIHVFVLVRPIWFFIIFFGGKSRWKIVHRISIDYLVRTFSIDYSLA